MQRTTTSPWQSRAMLCVCLAVAHPLAAPAAEPPEAEAAEPNEQSAEVQPQAEAGPELRLDIRLSEAVDQEVMRDKVMLLEVDASTSLEKKSRTIIMLEGRLVEMGGRWFALGKYVAPNPDPDGEKPFIARGGLYAVAWDSVTVFYSLSPDEFEEYMASVKRRRLEE